MDSHPGGTALIERFAGKDSTEAFERYHSQAKRCLADYDFLRIGRVVKERSLPIANHEMAVHGMVYDLRREYFVDDKLAPLSTFPWVRLRRWKESSIG